VRAGRGRWARLAALGLLLCWPHVSEAADVKEEETETHHIGEITVMAPQPGVEITTEKTIIRMDEFKKPGEVRSLTDVLNEIGGIDVQRINPLLASPGDEVSIRGLNEGRMVIEIDGRRINQTGHNGRYIVDWSTINMDDVERIEVIRGGHSVLHPFAIGGVINVITKKGKKTTNLKPDATVGAGIGRYDTSNLSASVNGGAADWIGYNVSASRQQTDGYLRNNFQDNHSYNGHLSFYLPKDATIELGAKYTDVNYGFPVINDPSRPDYDPDYPIFIPADADNLRHLPSSVQYPGDEVPQWTKHTTYLDAIFRMPVGPGEFKFHAFSQEGRRWVSSYSGTSFTNDVQVNDRTEGYILQYGDVKLGDHHLVTAGLEYQELGSPPANPIIYKVQSAYAQDVIGLGEKWRLTPGVRYYKVDMDTYYSWMEQGVDKPVMPTGGKQQTESGFYPSLKADFQAAPDTALYAAVSRSYRLPCP